MKKKQQHFNLTFLSPRKQIVPCKGREKGVNFIKAFLGSQTQKVEWRLLIVIARNLIDVKVLDVKVISSMKDNAYLKDCYQIKFTAALTVLSVVSNRASRLLLTS